MIELNKEYREFLEEISKRRAIKKSNGYFYYFYKGKGYKRARIIMQLHLNKILSPFEIVHHKDRNKINDSIENLEVLNISVHSQLDKNKPEDWKPANTINPEIVKKIRELSSQMVKINYSEIKRKLEKEGIKISDLTIARYIKN